jgi:hypothetical protein
MRCHSLPNMQVKHCIEGRGLLGRVQIVQALHEDVSEDVANSGTPRKFSHWHVLAASLHHLGVPQRVAIQKMQ